LGPMSSSIVPSTSADSNATLSPESTRIAPVTLLKDFGVLAWSAAIIVLAGLFNLLGTAYERGRVDALGLYTLGSTKSPNEDVYIGVLNFASATVLVLVGAVILFATASILRLVAKRVAIIRALPSRLHVNARFYGWCILILTLFDAAFINTVQASLNRYSDGLILRRATEIGSLLPLLSDSSLAVRYEFLFGILVALLIWMSWWLSASFFRQPWSRITFASWSSVNLMRVLLLLSRLRGVESTVNDFPIVTISSQQTLFAPDAITVLLGSDDKQYALLSVETNPKSNDAKRMIVYVPRSEVKGMTVTGMRSLQSLGQPN
jgi:hypothetical protein